MKDSSPKTAEKVTLHQCKDQVASMLGHGNWHIAEYRMSRDDMDRLHDKAAELYASKKLEQFRSLSLPAVESKSEGWIACSERLPEVGKEVWISTEHYQCVGRFLKKDDHGIVFSEGRGYPRYNFVTHWRPLPLPPK